MNWWRLDHMGGEGEGEGEVRDMSRKQGTPRFYKNSQLTDLTTLSNEGADKGKERGEN